MARKKPVYAYDARKAKGYIDRVRQLLENQKSIATDISEVCGEAKGNGLEPVYIRYAAREAMIDAAERSERDAKRAMYLHAVGLAVEAVESGEMSAREAASVYGVGKTSVYKALSVRELSANREMTADDLGEWLPNHDSETGELPREMTADDLGDPLLVIDRSRAEFREKVRVIAASLKPAEVAPVAPAPTDDQLVIPERLRRERAA